MDIITGWGLCRIAITDVSTIGSSAGWGSAASLTADTNFAPTRALPRP
jgi:hypothetical protein